MQYNLINSAIRENHYVGCYYYWYRYYSQCQFDWYLINIIGHQTLIAYIWDKWYIGVIATVHHGCGHPCYWDHISHASSLLYVITIIIIDHHCNYY